jgi:hypothetical protein
LICFWAYYTAFTLSHTKELTLLGTAKIKVVIAEPDFGLHGDF